MNAAEQRRLADDGAFLAAEQSIAELRQQTDAAAGKIASIAEEKVLVYPVDDKMWERYDAIVSSPPGSIGSAIIKLRVLADPELGIESGCGVQEAEAVRQVLDFLETLGRSGAAGEGRGGMNTRRSTRSLDPLAALSFVADRDGKTLPKPTGDQHPRCFWNVTPTGDYDRDCEIGTALGLEYLALEEADPHGPGHLQMIVADMPRPLTGVEVGFLIMVSYAARAGAPRARKIAAYWEEQERAARPAHN